MSGTKAGDKAGDVLYSPICGFQGGLAAILVGLKQSIPDNNITVFSFINIHVRDLPSIYLVTLLLVGLVTRSTLSLFPFALYATFTAWFYLRFFAHRADSFIRGDSSPEFRFASFFPSLLHPAVDEVARMCSKMTRIEEFLASDAQKAQQSNAVLLGFSSPSRDSVEASRRRERGARALEERLGLRSGSGTGGSGGVDEKAVAVAVGGKESVPGVAVVLDTAGKGDADAAMEAGAAN